MTEEEAKTKWCPMARVENINGNRSQSTANIEESRCIASDCMMYVPERHGHEGSMAVVNGGHCGLINN